MADVRARPVGRSAAGSTAPTTGTAFAIPTTKVVTQIKIYVSAGAYVGFGTVLSPIPATSVTNSVYQEAATEVVYSLDGVRQTDGSHVYVYAVAGTINTNVSFYG